MDKMGVRSGQREALLAIFGAMATVCPDAVFEQQCALLEQVDVPAATEYFKKNWLRITHQCVSCMKARQFIVGVLHEGEAVHPWVSCMKARQFIRGCPA